MRYSLISFLFVASAALATENNFHQPIHGVAAFKVGWDDAQVGRSQYVQLLVTDPAPDYFDVNSTTSSRLALGGFLGIEFPLQYNHPMRWQTGVAYYQTNAFAVNGIDYFLSLAEFGDKAYTYQIKSQRVLIENKYLVQFHPHVYGYVLGGLGIALNNARDYHERALVDTTVANGVFQDNTTASLSYALGFGLEGLVSETIRVALGYQYSDLGQITLGEYNNGNTGETLTQDHTPTQELILQISLLF